MKNIGQLIRDIISVVIGVLVALVINNWNEDRKDEKYLNQIFISINEELKESNRDIKENIPKQQVLVDSLGKYLNDETVSIYDIIIMAGGIHGAKINNYSWRAIANSKIELVEIEKIFELSEIDESKEYIELKQEKLLDFMIENLKKTNKEKKEVFMLLTQEIISTEKYLQFEIEKFLKR